MTCLLMPPRMEKAWPYSFRRATTSMPAKGSSGQMWLTPPSSQPGMRVRTSPSLSTATISPPRLRYQSASRR